ncbi:MAG: flagellar biosynthetic protein FliQ [Planctomycetes bacterium]|nr:flagellar biosynthetic protein FliQ [Planctomycetota bacterium]
MSFDSAVDLTQQALIVAAELSLPMLGVGLVIGLLFSVLQAMTQVHEQTLSFIPKLLAMALVAFLLMPWILSVITDYTREVFLRLGTTGAGG